MGAEPWSEECNECRLFADGECVGHLDGEYPDGCPDREDDIDVDNFDDSENDEDDE